MSLDTWEFPEGRPVRFNCQYVAGDSAQAIVRQAGVEGLTIYVTFKRSWRDRLFSWPWRPWQAYYGEPAPMRVDDLHTVQQSDGVELTFTLTQADA